MIRGVGSDILEIERIKRTLLKHPERLFLKLLTKDEIVQCKGYKDPCSFVAGRFCAKEAVAKALGCGLGKKLGFKDISILPDSKGKPIVTLSNKVKKEFNNPQIELSISHCRKYAVAFAISI